ncbi:MAG TPA: hypothetical protein VFE28_14800 [Candidatus Krumholzibacteria bacterium]|nr:hypothetical protein [Candidatus Krumholzibacteria bacterium]
MDEKRRQERARPRRPLPFVRTLLGIVAIALALRLVQWAELRDYVLVRVPLVDAGENVEWAARLAQGTPEPQDVFYKPPFYPHALSWAMRLLGPGVGTAYAFNTVLGGVNVAAIAFWVRSFASPPVALAAAALAAIYRPFLYFEIQALPTTLGVTLSLASLLLLGGAMRAGGRRKLPWRLGAAGLTLGLLALTRPSFLLWTGTACLWLALGLRRWRSAVVVAVTAALTILPVTLMNRQRGGEWVLVSANGGINFYLGNNPDWQRTWLLRPGLAWEDLVRRIPESERQGQARWDRYFMRQAIHWARTEPFDFAAALGRRTLQYLSSAELDRNLDPRGFSRRSWVLRSTPRYACLAPWLLLGLVLAWRRRGSARLTVLFWGCGFVSTVLVFVSERYRVDAAPASIACTALAIGEVLSLLRRRPIGRSMGPVAGLVVVSAALAYSDLGGLGRVKGPQAAALEGVAYYKEGDLAHAVESLQLGVATDPFDADAHYQLGTALQKQRRTAVALASYEAAEQLVPTNPKPPMAAGWLLKSMGRRDEALQRYEKAARLDPTNSMVLLETAHLLEEMGRRDPARGYYESALEHATDAGTRDDARRALDRLH